MDAIKSFSNGADLDLADVESEMAGAIEILNTAKSSCWATKKYEAARLLASKLPEDPWELAAAGERHGLRTVFFGPQTLLQRVGRM